MQLAFCKANFQESVSSKEACLLGELLDINLGNRIQSTFRIVQFELSILQRGRNVVK